MKDNIKQYDKYVVRLPKEAERKNGAGKLNGCYFFKPNKKNQTIHSNDLLNYKQDTLKKKNSRYIIIKFVFENQRQRAYLKSI